MSNYKITEYSFNRAKKINLIIKPSKNLNKKIDVYTNDGTFIHSIGDVNYQDYPNYCIVYGKQFGDARKLLYHNRHKRNADVKYSKQWLALKYMM